MAQNDIGIDLGTTTIIIAQEGKGVVLNQPSVVAMDTRKNTVLEAGDKALAMVGRTPNYISAIFPLKDGVISDHTMTRELICRFVKQVYSSHMVKPRVAVCVPAAITGIESDAVVEAVVAAGARQVYLIDEPIAAALGSGIDITQPDGRMIIDIGGSYRSMIALNRGKYFDSTEQKKFAFNPFLCDRDKNGKYLYIDTTDAESADDQIKTIVAIISYIWKVREPMLPAENAILRKSVIGFYDYVNNSSIGEKHERIFPTLITYRAYLKEVFSKRMTEFEKQKFEIEELLLLLEPYTDGELSFLLNATENVDIVHDRLIAFDMEDASKKEYFPLVAIITLQMIVDKIKKRQGFAKELIIDEALDFLQDEKFGDFIAYLYRTFRKKEGSITLAAQNILFLKNMPSSIKDSIIINCATKIILDHSEHRQNLPEVKAVLSITDEEAYMIESLQRTERWREFFIKMSNDAFIFRNEVSDFAAVAFDSRQATVVRLKQLFNESGSTYTAINRYLKERRKKYG